MYLYFVHLDETAKRMCDRLSVSFAVLSFFGTLTAYLYKIFIHTSYHPQDPLGKQNARYSDVRHLQPGRRARHNGDKCHSRIFRAGRTRSTLSDGAGP